MRTQLRSTLTNTFLAKIWVPILCIAFAVGLSRGEIFTRNFFLACPFLILALFGLSVAVLEVHGSELRYRRLLKWRPIHASQIVSARVEAPPVIGSIRLTKFLFPWGRLYFALDANKRSNPLSEGIYPLVDYVRSQKGPLSECQPSSQIQAPNAAGWKLVVAALVGAVLYILLLMFLPSSTSLGIAAPSPPVPRPTLLHYLSLVIQLFGMVPFQCFLVILFAFLAIYRRRNQDSWIFALLAGAGVPYIVRHWFSLWF
jgi:hypothetical protein